MGKTIEIRLLLHRLSQALLATCLMLFLAASSAEAAGRVRVSLFSLFHPRQLDIRIVANSRALLSAGSLRDIMLTPEDTIRLSKNGNQITLTLTDLYGRIKQTTNADEVRLTADEPPAFTLSLPGKLARRFRGELSVKGQGVRQTDALQIVLSVESEAVVASVVAAEMRETRYPEALKALAVVARTFLSSHTGRHADEGFDFCDTTHCQLYRGEDDLANETTSHLIKDAVAATTGEVLQFNNRPIEGFYTAVCGGLTATPEAVWGGTTPSRYPYKRIICRWCIQSPYNHWERSADAASVLHALSAALGYSLSRATEISVQRFAGSDVVQTVLINDNRHQALMSSDEFRRAVGRKIGWNRILSPTFRLERRGNFFVFRGRGFGSQVGLCIAGTLAQARAGRNYHTILNFYYPRTESALQGKRQKKVFSFQFSVFSFQQGNCQEPLPSSRPLTSNAQSAAGGGRRLYSQALLPFAFCLLPFAFNWLADLGNALIAYGALGLFGISLLDSAFIPLPSGPDLAMIALSASNHAMMPLYALGATVGSTIGCTILYLIARRAGIVALQLVTPERRVKIENLLGRYDMLAIMVPAILPPPFPFKPFVLSAGAFKLKLSRFIAAIFIGRAVRFLLEGWLAVWFGEEASGLIRQNGLKVLLALGVLLLIFFAVKIYKKKREAQPLVVDDITTPR